LEKIQNYGKSIKNLNTDLTLRALQNVEEIEELIIKSDYLNPSSIETFCLQKRLVFKMSI